MCCNAGLLVFLAHSVSTASIEFGTPADQRVELIPTAPTNLSATRSLTLSGGFWSLSSGEAVSMSATWENGTVLSKGTIVATGPGQKSFTLPLTGAQRLNGKGRWTEAGALSIVFDKQKKH